MGLLNIAFHPIYQLPLPSKHRFPMEKYDLLPKQLIYEGTCNAEDFFSPIAADQSVVERIHDPDYVKKLLELHLNKKEVRKIGFPLSKQLIEREFEIGKKQMIQNHITLKDMIMNIQQLL